jgi:hypothetical protein
VARLQAGCRGSVIGMGNRPALHPMVTGSSVPRDKSSRHVKLTTYLYLIACLRMLGNIGYLYFLILLLMF